MQGDNSRIEESIPPENITRDDDSWIQVHFFFARCCGSGLTLPMLPSLLVEEMTLGNIEPLGWDEQSGMLFANAWGQPCSTCLRRLRDALSRALTGLGYDEQTTESDEEEGEWGSE